MNRRAIAAVTAMLLAVVGSVLLARYVAVADQRAMAGMEPVTVLVVTGPIAEGTPAEDVAELVTTRAIPATAASPDSVTSLDQVAGRLAATELLPGEHLLVHRFVEPEELAVSTELEVPPGLHRVTIRLDSARVLGGHLRAGDTVGVFMSWEPEPRETRLVLHKVLVTRVQGGISPADPAAPQDPAAPAAPEPAAADSVMVTLALDTAAAQKVIFAAEYERIWLSLEDAEVPDADAGTATRENLFP